MMYLHVYYVRFLFIDFGFVLQFIMVACLISNCDRLISRYFAQILVKFFSFFPAFSVNFYNLYRPQVLPESPRWLLSRGKNKEAVKILKKAAKTNKVHFEDLPSNFRLEEEDRGLKEIFREFFHSKKLLFRWIIIVLNWFVISSNVIYFISLLLNYILEIYSWVKPLNHINCYPNIQNIVNIIISIRFVISSIYYGLTLNIGKLGGNLYINFTVAAVMEFLGNLLCLLMDKTGRKAMHLSLMFLTGAACLSSAIPVLFGNKCKNCILFICFHVS